MPNQVSNLHPELKAVILAAGKESGGADVKPILLQNLGSRKSDRLRHPKCAPTG